MSSYIKAYFDASIQVSKDIGSLGKKLTGAVDEWISEGQTNEGKACRQAMVTVAKLALVGVAVYFLGLQNSLILVGIGAAFLGLTYVFDYLSGEDDALLKTLDRIAQQALHYFTPEPDTIEITEKV